MGLVSDNPYRTFEQYLLCYRPLVAYPFYQWFDGRLPACQI